MTNNLVKATSENLPKVDIIFAVNNYIRTNGYDTVRNGCQYKVQAPQRPVYDFINHHHG